MTYCNKMKTKMHLIKKILLRSIWYTILIGLVGGMIGVPNSWCKADTTPKEVLDSLWMLPEFNDHPSDYRAAPYLNASVALQALGKDKAREILLIFAKYGGDRVIILCRMLFTQKGKSAFRDPWIGWPTLLGKTSIKDWPCWPITLSDGVPFLVVSGYEITGKPETGASYLSYCLSCCDWNPVAFHQKSEQQMKESLQKLLTSRKWKQQITPSEKQFLQNQLILPTQQSSQR